jgi:soluble lytic murein transglycosylase-like protein
VRAADLWQRYGGGVVRALIAYDGGDAAVAAWEAGRPGQQSADYVRAVLGQELSAAASAPATAPVPATRAG